MWLLVLQAAPSWLYQGRTCTHKHELSVTEQAPPLWHCAWKTSALKSQAAGSTASDRQHDDDNCKNELLTGFALKTGPQQGDPKSSLSKLHPAGHIAMQTHSDERIG